MTKDDLFFRAADLITKIHDMEADLEAQGGDHEITSLQSNLLKILYFSGPQNLSGLSHCMHMNLPNSSREVKKLTELGYIQKTSSPDDRRKTELSLTVRGKEKVNLSMDEMKAAFFDRSGEWDSDRISRCIESITVLEQELFTKKD